MDHVFISYQHEYRETAVVLRDALQSYGFSTWFDEDDMAASTLESMARGVEQASVMIMCMSMSYSLSDNCKSEVEYAKRKNKPIIPIRVEAGFKPDGLLGIAAGSKMVIDFSNPDLFDEKFEKLLRELAARDVVPNVDEVVEYTGEDNQDDEYHEEENGGHYVGGNGDEDIVDADHKDGDISLEQVNQDDEGTEVSDQGYEYTADDETIDDGQTEGEDSQTSYEFICCACVKKQTTISPE